MCMRVCVSAHLHIYVNTYSCISIYTDIDACAFIHIFLRWRKRLTESSYAYMYKLIYTDIENFKYIYMYIYIYTYIREKERSSDRESFRQSLSV